MGLVDQVFLSRLGFKRASLRRRSLGVPAVRVFDGAAVSPETTRDRARQEIIAAVGGVEVPAGAIVIDGRGKTLLPGLIDAHTHTFSEEQLKAALFSA